MKVLSISGTCCVRVSTLLVERSMWVIASTFFYIQFWLCLVSASFFHEEPRRIFPVGHSAPPWKFSFFFDMSESLEAISILLCLSFTCVLTRY